MKTITEFPGIHIRNALVVHQSATRAAWEDLKTRAAVQAQESPAAENVEATPKTTAPEQTHESPAPQQGEQDVAAAPEQVLAQDSTPGADSGAKESESSTPPTEAAPANPKVVIKPRAQLDEAAFSLIKSKMQEALKVEGERLDLMLTALEVLDRRKPKELLRRVVVLTVSEKEKAPAGGIKKGDHFFVAEYLPDPRPARMGRGPERGPRDGKRGKGRKGGRSRTPRDGQRDRTAPVTKGRAQNGSERPGAKIQVRPQDPNRPTGVIRPRAPQPKTPGPSAPSEGSTG